MTMRASAALQAAVFARLSTFPSLAGFAIFDAIPPASFTGSFVLLGPESVRDQSDVTGTGSEHRFDVSVISDANGFLQAKGVAALVCEALVDQNLTLTVGSLISLQFLRASAKRIDQGVTRRIDMQFRARLAIS
jgi:hypothetical protein